MRLKTSLAPCGGHRVTELSMLPLKAIPGAAGNFAFGRQEEGFSATARPLRNHHEYFLCLRSFQPAAVKFQQPWIQPSLQHDWCFDRPVCAAFCWRCKPQILSRISVSSSPLPPSHDIELTPHFKTLQSLGSVLLWFSPTEFIRRQ